MDDAEFPEQILHCLSSDQWLILEYVLGISKGCSV